MPDPIKKKRKKHLRNLPRNKFDLNATVKMADYSGGKNNKTYYAAPKITFKTKKEGEEIQKKLKANENYTNQSFDEALAAGEVYEFKNKKRAERFAAGSWKKGKEKREEMKKYRAEKKKKRIDKRNG